jgi:glycolate oxidase
MPFNRVTNGIVRKLKAICGEEHVRADAESLQHYAHDETEDLLFLPEVVVKPGSPGEISAIMVLANEHAIPVTPRGAGTGLSGGALAAYGGICLSIERLNRIIEIDERNLQVTTEAGVITQVLQEAVEAKKLFYPPDPASRGSCFIGGNIAENSGGPRALKYGVVKDYVLNLEVVLPTGLIMWTGANVLKNATGYNLTQLMVGSEGTLGIVTKAVLKLIPLPTEKLTLLAPFNSAESACAAVAAIFRKGITPSACEFMERDAIVYTLPYVKAVQLPLEDDVQAHLLIEVDGFQKASLLEESERIASVLDEFGSGEVLFAESSEEQASLWALRRKVGEAVKSHSVYKEEDTVVPRAELPGLLKGVKDIGRRYGFQSVCYGHAGDGNLHVNVLRGNMTDDQWQITAKEGVREIFELTKSLGGTISGEHGIGLVQKNYMDIPFTSAEIELMRSIKRVFDPNGVLNPGKVFPGE